MQRASPAHDNNNTSYPAMIDLLSIYLQLPICIVGSILNFVSFLVFIRIGIMNATYILMTAKAFADANTLFLRIIQTFVRCETLAFCQIPNLKYKLYLFVLYAEVPITNITENISCWITLALAIEHYIAIKHFVQSRIYSTIENAKKVILILTILSTILNLPFFFMMRTHIRWEQNSKNQTIPVVITEKRMFMDSIFYPIHSWFRFCVVHTIPLLCLCIFNSLLFSTVYKRNQSYLNNNKTYFKTLRKWSKDATSIKGPLVENPIGPCSSPSPNIDNRISVLLKKQKSQYKLTIQLILIILLFLIGQIPHAFAYVGIYRFISNCEKNTFLKDCPRHELYRFVTMILTLVCYSSNFFVYLFLNCHFKASLFKLLRISNPCCVKFQQPPSIKTDV